MDVWPSAESFHKWGSISILSFFIYNIILKEESKSNYVELDLDEVLDIEEEGQRRKFILNVPVSYTHLTLPTILRV